MSAHTAPQKASQSPAPEAALWDRGVNAVAGGWIKYNTKANACQGQVQLQGASGMEHALHTAGSGDNAVGFILELEAESLQEMHHRANQLCVMAS